MSAVMEQQASRAFKVGLIASKNASESAKQVRSREVTFPELANRLIRHKPSQKKDGPAWVPGVSRSINTATDWHVLALDIEGDCQNIDGGRKQLVKPKAPEVQDVADWIEELGWSAVLSTSWWHEGPSEGGGTVGPRYRIVFEISRPVGHADRAILGRHVAAMIGLEKCYDPCVDDPNRFFYMPTAPAERMHLAQGVITNGKPLDVDALLAQCKVEAQVVTQEQVAPPPAREVGSVIAAFNEQADFGTILAPHGYKKIAKRWLSPVSSSGDPGIVIFDNGRMYCHHHDDVLYHAKHTRDAFDVWMMLEHGGDMTAAVRAAARMLGMDSRAQSVTYSAPDWTGAEQATQAPKDPVNGSKPEARPVEARPLITLLDESGPLAPLPTLVRGYLPADGCGMLWGPPASYKSFVALGIALGVAVGREWMGIPVIKGPVWYLAGEGQQGMRLRVAAWRAANKYTAPLDNFYLSSRSVTLDSETGMSPETAALISMVTEGRAPSLIVVDTLARSMCGDESSTRDASRFVSALDAIVHAVRASGGACCLLLVHHSRKDGEIYRGSSALRGAMDFEFELEAKASSVTMTPHKTKEGALPDALRMRAQAETLGEALDNHGISTMMSSLTMWPEFGQARNADPVKQNAERLKPFIVEVLNANPKGMGIGELRATLRTMKVTAGNDAIQAAITYLTNAGVITKPESKKGTVARFTLNLSAGGADRLP